LAENRGIIHKNECKLYAPKIFKYEDNKGISGSLRLENQDIL